MKFRDGEFVATDDVYYDLFEGGYIDPRVLLDDEAVADEVCAAIQLIKDFISNADSAGVLEVC